jgi:SAM-dependent methyltransferase
VRATRCYRSQFREPEADLARRFQRCENYWELQQPTAAPPPLSDVYHKSARTWSLRDMRRIASRFRWHNLDEILPAGQGICVDLGAGTGRHRALAEARGYRWIGLEKSSGAGFGQGEAERTPFAAGTADCVVAWQVMEYVEQPEQVFAEAARVLAAGGVFCGSVSFLEPVHGRSYYGISPLLLERLLDKHGFADISIKPGVCGFALQTWTWLRRLGGPAWGRIAFPLAGALAAPTLCARFFASWCWTRFGRGSGHGMRWVIEKEPLEFAGHVLFAARKIHCT